MDEVDTADIIKTKLKIEGRAARNIVSWNVPTETAPGETTERDDGFTTVTSSRRKKSGQHLPKQPQQSKHGRGPSSDGNSEHTHKRQPSRRGKGSSSNDASKPHKEQYKADDRGGVEFTPTRGRKETVQTRLWGYLLSSLIRATDALYEVCEQEENELQCKEVIPLLETAIGDFNGLISRFKLHSNFEKSVTSGSIPPSCVWSVRKISPIHSARVAAGSPSRPTRTAKSGGLSYADQVKGNTAQYITTTTTTTTTEPSDPEDEIEDFLADGRFSPLTPASMSSLRFGDATYTSTPTELGMDMSSSPTEPNSTETAPSWSDLAKEDDGWGSNSEDETRSPGSSVLLHNRLSSPSRRRTKAENLRRYEEKQTRAAEKRERQAQEKKDQLWRERSKLEAAKDRRELEEFRKAEDMVEKVERATELRGSHLEVVRKRAHSQKEKVEEAAWIERMNVENKKLEFDDKLNESQERLQEMEVERSRKTQERAAREGAAAARRRIIEGERIARNQEMEAKQIAREKAIAERKAREAGVRQQEAKRKENVTLKNTTARSELNEKTDARLSPAKKSKESPGASPARCSRGVDLSGSGLFRSGSASSGRTQNAFGSRPSDDFLPAAVQQPPPRARNEKSIKKKVKRIRQRMSGCSLIISATGEQLAQLEGSVAAQVSRMCALKEDDATTKDEMLEAVNELTARKKIFESAKPKPWNRAQADEAGSGAATALKSLSLAVAKPLRKLHSWQLSSSDPKISVDAAAFDSIVGSILKSFREKPGKITVTDFVVLSRVLIDLCVAFPPTSVGITASGSVATEPPAGHLPLKSIVLALTVVEVAITDKRCGGPLAVLGTGDYVLKLIDTFVRTVPSVYAAPPSEATTAPREPEAAAAIAKILGKTIFSLVGSSEVEGSSSHEQQQTVDDLTMYCNSVGLFDVVTQLMYRVPRRWVEASPSVAAVVEDCLDILLLFCSFDPRQRRPPQTEFLDMVHTSHLAGIVSPLMCQMLPLKRAEADLSTYDPSSLLLLGLKILNRLSVLDLPALQSTLSEDWLSTSLCYVLVQVLTHCCDAESRQAVAMLHEAIYLVGKFTETNPRGRQLLVDGGGFATILPILCKLPFKYFSEDIYMEVLFPTLLCICHGSDKNASILQRELSCSTVVSFIDRKLYDKQLVSKDRFSCCNRFPTSELSAARAFFDKQEIGV